VILAIYFHFKDFVGLVVGFDFGVCQQGKHAVLKSFEPALDLAFCLRRRSHQMSNSKSAKRTLKFAAWITAVIARAGAEEAERIGVNGLRKSDLFKGRTEVAEVIPSGVGRDKSTGNIEAGMVVYGEKQGLFAVCRPPLMNGAVVLPEFSKVSTSEPSVSARFAHRRREEIGKVGFDIRLYAGASFAHAVNA